MSAPPYDYVARTSEAYNFWSEWLTKQSPFQIAALLATADLLLARYAPRESLRELGRHVENAVKSNIGHPLAWKALGLEPGASVDEIKAAYRKRAFETHPDRGGSAKEFRRVRRAFDHLIAVAERSGTGSEAAE
jgi:hypothetical protein